MYDTLKKQVLEGNKRLVEHDLVTFTWGNLSAADRENGVIAIKPSGVSYEKMSINDIVIVDIKSGDIVEGALNPSSDTPTHLELYRAFPEIFSVIHTHSSHATAFAQAKVGIACLGTTHADYFNGTVPVVGELSKDEILTKYEHNTGSAIVRYFRSNSINPMEIPAALSPGHGPFVWGKSIDSAVYNAVVLEEIARMNSLTLQINPTSKPLSEDLLNKHYYRKHGLDAYYGQYKG